MEEENNINNELFIDLSEDSTKVGNWEWNIQTGETIFDERWANIIGYNLEELQPTTIKTWIDITNPEDLSKSNDELQRYFDKKVPIYEAEARIRHKSGKWVWVLDRGSISEYDSNGNPLKMIGSHYDITTRKYIELINFNNEYKKLLDSAPFPLIITNLKNSEIKYANKRAKNELEFNHLVLSDLYTNDYFVDSNDRNRLISLLNDNKYISDFEVELYNFNKKKFWALISAQIIDFEGLPSLIVQINNITEKKSLHSKLIKEEEKYRLLANSIVDVILIFNTNNVTFEYFSPSIYSLSGYSCDEALLLSPSDLFLSDIFNDLVSKYSNFKNSVKTNDKSEVQTINEVQLKKKDGDIIWVELSSKLKLNNDGEIEVISVCRDINDRKITEAKIEYLYLNNLLTQMPNKVALRLLEDDLVNRHDVDNDFSVLFLDLDDFGKISNDLGYQYGDLIISQISQRLREFTRNNGLLFHYESDEFVIVLNEHIIDKVYNYAKSLKSIISQQLLINGRIHILNVSIGFEVQNKFSFNGDLIKNSKIALSVAKKTKNTIKQFDNEMYYAISREQILENDLRYSLENKELELYFQPIFNVFLNIVDQAEALLRWNHPRLGIISPNEFIPIAERTKLILPITDWIIHEACLKLSSWNEEILGPLSISINLSFVTIIERKEELFEVLKKELKGSRIDPKRLKLEITESSLVQDSHEVIKVFIRLRELGLSLALDDFGTGYSSFAYLKSLPLDIVKIDRSLIKSIEVDQRSLKIVEAMISVLHGLDLSVTIEGVENLKQYELLSKLNADFIQGYLFSKPLKLIDFKAYYFASKDKSFLPINKLLVERLGENKYWKKEWESGNSLIDSQHKELLELLLYLENTLKSDYEIDIIKNYIERFIKKVKNHFKDEIEILTEIGYPKIKVHQEKHNHLIENIEYYLNNLNYDEINLNTFMLNFNKFKTHFLEDDFDFFKFVSELSSNFPINFISTNKFDVDSMEYHRKRTYQSYNDSIFTTLLKIALNFIKSEKEEYSMVIQKSLESIGLMLNVDRAYIFNYEWSKSTCSNTFEWCSDGTSAQIDSLQDVPLSEISEWVNAHVIGESIFIPDVEVLEPDSPIRMILEPQGVKSLLTLPIIDGNVCYGFIGFDSVKNKHIYSKNELITLKNLSALLHAALMKIKSYN